MVFFTLFILFYPFLWNMEHTTQHQQQTLNVDSIAKLLDLTPRRVQQLVKEKILPQPYDRGKYAVVPCVIAYIKYLRGLIDGEGGDYMVEKTRLTKAQATKTEIETNRLKGDLISVTDAERGWGALLGAFRAKMITIPSRAALAVQKKSEYQAEKILTEMIYEALTELSNWNPNEANRLDEAEVESDEKDKDKDKDKEKSKKTTKKATKTKSKQ